MWHIALNYHFGYKIMLTYFPWFDKKIILIFLLVFDELWKIILSNKWYKSSSFLTFL